MKQQQAGVVQAWQSVRQSDEANAQGRAIMVFTVVTIFFVSCDRAVNSPLHQMLIRTKLPLSFMSFAASCWKKGSKDAGLALWLLGFCRHLHKIQCSSTTVSLKCGTCPFSASVRCSHPQLVHGQRWQGCHRALSLPGWGWQRLTSPCWPQATEL